MKSTKKFFAPLLALTFSLGIFAGCAPHSQDTDQYKPNNSTVEVNPLNAGYEKQYCTATMDEDFFWEKIIVTLMPSANGKEYTLEDFKEYEFSKIRIYVSPVLGPEKPRSRITLTLKNPSKENALSAIRLIEQRPDVYSVNPDYYMTADNSTNAHHTDNSSNETQPQETYEKYYCTITVEANFEDIIEIKIMPNLYPREYTLADFPEINCIEIVAEGTTTSAPTPIPKEIPFHRWCLLRVKGTKEDILNAVHTLEKRDDILAASPLCNPTTDKKRKPSTRKALIFLFSPLRD